MSLPSPTDLPPEWFVILDGRPLCMACGEPPEAGHHPMVCAARLDEQNERLLAFVAGPKAPPDDRALPPFPLRHRGLSGLCWTRFVPPPRWIWGIDYGTTSTNTDTT